MTLLRQPKFASDAKFLCTLGDAVQEAFEFGKTKHFHQKRKYTGEPYFWHPLEVASLAVSQTFNRPIEDQIRVAIAGLLHDTVEDTDTKFDQIASKFGEQAALDVFFLTDPVDKNKGNRAIRCLMSQTLISVAPPLIQGVKMCDMFTNIKSIGSQDPNFVVTYAREKRAVLNRLSEEAFAMFPNTHERLSELLEGILYEPTT